MREQWRSSSLSGLSFLNERKISGHLWALLWRVPERCCDSSAVLVKRCLVAGVVRQLPDMTCKTLAVLTLEREGQFFFCSGQDHHSSWLCSTSLYPWVQMGKAASGERLFPGPPFTGCWPPKDYFWQNSPSVTVFGSSPVT